MTVRDEEYTNSAARLVKLTNNSKYYQQEATVSEDYRTGSKAGQENKPEQKQKRGTSVTGTTEEKQG